MVDALSALPGEAPALALLFVLIFALNLIPAFAPPTWMALALVGFQYHDTSAALLAGVGAVAATLGRLTLAKLSHRILRQKLLSDAHRANIDVIKNRLEKRTTLTVGLFLFYAFSPLPSNFLFIAYGLTGLPLLRVALPFFVGRLASYGFFIVGGAAAGRRFEIDLMVSGAYALVWFIGTQLLILGALYCFARVDWKVLFESRKLAWLPKTSDERPIHLP
jgi:membrane protein DedA with SNARE-associated domain